MQPSESDWKTYSRLVPVWRDRYLELKNKELVAILNEGGKTPTEKFWDTKTRMDEVEKILKDCLGAHSRSKMEMSMLLMRRYALIGDDDLEQFSQSFREGLGEWSQMANDRV